jgi:hypothetical protein
MTLDFSTGGKLGIKMKDYVRNLVKDFPGELKIMIIYSN